MGAECKKVNQNHHLQQYTSIQPQLHPAFGNIFYIRCERSKTDKAIKQVPCPNEYVLSALKKRIQFARECDNNMTLVQIYDYDIIDKHSQETGIWQAISDKSQFSCTANRNEPIVLIHFQYFPPSSCLSQVLAYRRTQIDKLLTKYGNSAITDTKYVKMWNYTQIDKLSSRQRQVVNIFYQQIQVIRMIDHIIGAVYFLHHFDVPHSALRPQQILVDQEGRFVLVDRQVFVRKSNYELALEYIVSKEKKKNGSQQIMNYLCPQYLPLLKNRVQNPQFNAEKADIYCVGLIALTMCLLDENQHIFQYCSYFKSIKMNQGQLTRRLVRMKERYSQAFSDLIRKMLKKNVNERINFAQLIDDLNPLLQSNLQAIKRVHSMAPNDDQAPEEAHFQETYEYGVGVDEQLLKAKLMKMEKQFQKVMNNRTLLFNRSINDCNLRQQQAKLLSKLEKIKTARSQMSTKTQPRKNASTSQARGNDKRYISGKQLEEIVWKQYENIKSQRQVEK